jgi:two-component system sensor histidine kinase KdpD
MAGIGNDSIIMLYLLGVLFSALFTRQYLCGIIAAILNAVTFIYFFAGPLHSFQVIRTNDLILLLFFLGTSLTGSGVVARLRRQMKIASQNEATAQMLYEIASKFVHITGKKEIITSGLRYVKENSGCAASVQLDGETEHYNEELELPSQVVCRQYPISGVPGTLYVKCADPANILKNDLLFRAAAAQIGGALEREKLYEDRERIRVVMENEKTKSTFLRSIAHDIRTPLTAISGASTLLAEQSTILTVDEKRRLASDINEETVWLTNLVENILNMTRIDQDKLEIHKEFEVIDDVVAEVVKRMERLWGGRATRISYPDEVVALNMDARLIAQVLINLLDNAVKHTRAGDEIALRVTVDDKRAVFSVANTGDSVPDNLKQRVFDAFYTSNKISADERRGVGLGLAICRAIIKAHHGEIWMEDNEPSGVKVIFTLPREDNSNGGADPGTGH